MISGTCPPSVVRGYEPRTVKRCDTSLTCFRGRLQSFLGKEATRVFPWHAAWPERRTKNTFFVFLLASFLRKQESMPPPSQSMDSGSRLRLAGMTVLLDLHHGYLVVLKWIPAYRPKSQPPRSRPRPRRYSSSSVRGLSSSLSSSGVPRR